MNQPTPRDYDKHPWKEAVLIGAAMLFTAIVTLTYSIRLLNSTDIVQKSRREIPERNRQRELPVPVVPTFTADKDDVQKNDVPKDVAGKNDAENSE